MTVPHAQSAAGFLTPIVKICIIVQKTYFVMGQPLAQ